MSEVGRKTGSENGPTNYLQPYLGRFYYHN